MRIRKFHGKSFKEILETVKQELGPDAVILSNNSKKDPLSGETFIEVTAAVDEEDTPSINKLNIANGDSALHKEVERLKFEIAMLRESVTKLFPTLNDNSKVSFYNLLIKNNIEPHLALMLLEKAKDMDELRDVIQREIKTPPKPFNEERGFIFYGLPGVGKTTTVFKLGRLLRANNEKIMIVSLDERISSVASVKEMASILKCKATIVREPKELYKIIHKEIEKHKILIDTPGDGNINYATELKHLLKDTPLRKCLVIDATMSKQANFRILKTMDNTAVDCIGFSKIDLTSNYGNLYNVAVLSGKPVSFLSLGAYLDENAKVIPPSSIKNLVVGGVCEN
ncbi:flagellar biosynthesis protein FlhF [Thermodesulfovibrio hydrogeniphilus]